MFKLLAKPLTRAEQDSILRAKISWILGHAHPTEVVLFGSAATYEMTSASDVDLFVKFANADERDQARRALYQSRPKDDWPHDLLLMTEAEFERSAAGGGGAAYVAKVEGRVIYRKGDNDESA